jgi:hypothetical protein
LYGLGVGAIFFEILAVIVDLLGVLLSYLKEKHFPSRFG